MSSFPVNITEITYIDTNDCISINDLNTGDLKKLIYNSKPHLFDKVVNSVKSLMLWKVNIHIREENDKLAILEKPHLARLEIDIKRDLGGEKLNPCWKVVKSFPDLSEENIRIIIQLPIITDKYFSMFYISNKICS